MFQKIIKAIKFKIMLMEQQQSDYKNEKSEKQSVAISEYLQDNLNVLNNTFDKSSDVVFREFLICDKKQTKAFICFIEGLENKTLINDNIIKPLIQAENVKYIEDKYSNSDIFTMIKNSIVNASEIKEANTIDEVAYEILSAKSALFIEGFTKTIIVNTTKIKTRNVEEPNTEALVRGPREGFVETININTSLIRRKIKNPNLKFEAFKLGKQTQTKVVICYIRGIASMKVVEEVRRRLNNIQTDSILESGYIEQFIEDHPLSPLPTIGNSERPDKVAGKILEGRVAILCDGTPFVLTVPYLFVENLQVSEDYYSHPYGVFFLRILRIIALLATVLVPALFIALSTFHPEMVPTVLLVTSAASKEGTPFPTIIETIVMITVFEILRESGVRLPRQLGQALSIVGVLVIGEAAVNAGIISSPMIIISALTGITSFIITPLLDFIILSRFVFIILSGVFGFYGIVLGDIAILAHICSLSSFGSSYFAPLAPFIWTDLKDGIIRSPIWLINKRPKSLKPEDEK